ncbi:hypothetical protein DCS_06555 [Drechmeria coniospora]|uniref:Uncharacterized protein n=1 Tax=Drechmeria coniospora TaxID=98403 RepID=A0A151GC25_DRECN|nr:hypothetical protein DCS_06555 [Drechmeria coniospora]KYK54595.1 hypothetical protein DCS_06555 [Drechmeria coniospora]
MQASAFRILATWLVVQAISMSCFAQPQQAEKRSQPRHLPGGYRVRVWSAHTNSNATADQGQGSTENSMVREADAETTQQHVTINGAGGQSGNEAVNSTASIPSQNPDRPRLDAPSPQENALPNENEAPPDENEAPPSQNEALPNQNEPPPTTTPKFEGLKLTTVTVPAPAEATPQTVTITELASTVTQTVTASCQQQPSAAQNLQTVIITEVVSTVTETITASCRERAPSSSRSTQQQANADTHTVMASASTTAVARPECPLKPTGDSLQVICNGQMLSSPSKPVGSATPSGQDGGNGVGVSTIPIPESSKPRTTYSSGSPPAPDSPPVVPVPGEGIARTERASVSRLVSTKADSSSSSSSALNEMAATATTTSNTVGAPPSPTSRPVSNAPDASAPLEPARLAPNAAAVAPAQPSVNLSGLTLSSVLNLGNLVDQPSTAPTQSAPAAA